MIINEFRWNILLRVSVITSIALLLAFVVTNKNWFFTPLVLAIVLALSIWSLVHYIEKTNKDLTYFILSIKQGGFTFSFPPGKRGITFKKLAEAFNDVIEEFRKVNLQRETHYQYLQLLTENIQAGIISYDITGSIELINPAARQLLGIHRLMTIGDLENANPKLYKTITELLPGQRQLLRTIIEKKELRLSIHVRELKMNDKTYRVVLLQDLNAELEDQEVEAWQRLTRVLTHEIMNSITPIVSLTEAVNSLLTKSDGRRKEIGALDGEDKEDLYASLQTIENRSKGLLKFVNAYKSFTKTPDLIIKSIDVNQLISRLVSLSGPELAEKKIGINTSGVRANLFAKADAEWLEQILINLLKNSIDALENRVDGKIIIEAYQLNRQTCIKIRDNGEGIPSEILDKIFIPFFTTKKKGTGIGLSLSRQIMKMHRGTLSVHSEPGVFTEVELKW